MSQVYPRLPPTGGWTKATDGTAMATTPQVDATLATSTVAYTPNIWSQKAANHPASDPDFVNVAPVTKAANMPY